MRTIAFTALLTAISIGSLGAQQTQQTQATTTATPPTHQDSDAPRGFVPEPVVVGQAVDLASRLLDGSGGSVDGFYPEFGDMITGAGWISGGPGYRRHVFDRHLLVDGSAAISWHGYKDAQARVELTDLAKDHLTLGFQVQWQDLTQVNYFGIGPNAVASQQSEYRLKETDRGGYGIVRANHWLSFAGRFGWIDQPTISSSVGPFDQDFPDARLVFPSDPGIAEQTSLLYGGAAIEADTRDFPSRPTRGGLYRAAAQVFSDRDLHQFSFRRYEAEGLQILPVVGERWMIGVHGWGVFSDTSAGNHVPFYLLPSLGGGNTLRGYDDYRFHDRNLLVFNVESRWAVLTHVDLALFGDAGNVAARAGDLNLDKTSYGGGFRVHDRTSTLLRMDLAHSREGWEVSFRLSDPFRLARRSLRASVVPFVP